MEKKKSLSEAEKQKLASAISKSEDWKENRRKDKSIDASLRALSTHKALTTK